jgi:hypothetical protein
MKKIKLYSWIFLLIILSVPAGFLTILTEKPYTPESEFILILIVGTIGTMFAVGGLSYIPYYVLKKNHSDYALKRALQCYTFFTLAMIGVAFYKYPEAMRKRDRYYFSMYYQEEFEKMALDELAMEMDQLPASVWKERKVISFSIVTEIQYNDHLIEKLKKGKDPEYLYKHDPEVQKIKKEIIDLYRD